MRNSSRRGAIVGSGVGDPNYNPDAGDEWWQPMTDEEVKTLFANRFRGGKNE